MVTVIPPCNSSVALLSTSTKLLSARAAPFCRTSGAAADKDAAAEVAGTGQRERARALLKIPPAPPPPMGFAKVML